MNLLKTLPLLFLMLNLCACAIGNKHQYHQVLGDISLAGTVAVAITTHDQRSYILSGNKSPDFVGLSRGGYGNPFNVVTETGNPLAHDMNISISNTLRERGFNVIYIFVSHNDNFKDVLNKLTDNDAERFILFSINEWKSDTYMNTALIYDVTASVFDNNGKLLAEKNISGRDHLGGSFGNPPAHAKLAVPLAFKEKIEILLDSTDIAEQF